MSRLGDVLVEHGPVAQDYAVGPGLSSDIRWVLAAELNELRDELIELRRIAALTPDGDRPEIVTLVGSTRYPNAFLAAGHSESLEGRIVLGPWSYVPGSDLDTATLNRLQRAHKHMIRMADEVLVVTVDGYIGDHTRDEVEHAKKSGKPVRRLDFRGEPAAAPTNEQGS